MRIIVNDTSCLIDLRKAALLHAALLLPFQFQVALPLIHSELHDFSQAEIEDLKARGLEVVDLPAALVERAIGHRSASPTLSLNDCLSMALAQDHGDAILLTGDRSLRVRAEELGLEVHGVLWVSDQLEAVNVIEYGVLLQALERLRADPVVFVPDNEVNIRIDRLRALLG